MGRKQKGQYMTPPWAVKMVLDQMGYSGDAEAAICEPSFGDGAFLCGIADRIMTKAKTEGLDAEEVKRVLLSCMYGIEKDPELYGKGVERLVTFLSLHGIDTDAEEWKQNLLCGDTLLLYPAWKERFRYIIGNPPYVRVHNLPEEARKMIRGLPLAGYGMQDLYMAFYEICLIMLAPDGRLAFLSPDSFLKNSSAGKFRVYLAENRILDSLIDFKGYRVFPDADTYSCICVLNRSGTDKFRYREYGETGITKEAALPEGMLGGDPWNLGTQEDRTLLRQIRTADRHLSDLANIRNGIATNRDALYVVRPFVDPELTESYLETEMKHAVWFCDKRGTVREIETGILRKCVKGSKYGGTWKKEYLIFPYAWEADRYIPLEEEELAKWFPLAYRYLMSIREELAKRNMEAGVPWYAYARSQGLSGISMPKIVIRHVKKYGEKLTAGIMEAKTAVYSGIFCMAKAGTDGNGKIMDRKTYMETLTFLLNVLQSEEFARYADLVGKPMSGGYVWIGPKMAEEFGLRRFRS